MTTDSVDFFFSQIHRFRVLTPEEVIGLARQVQAWQAHPEGPAAASYLVRLRGVSARNRLVEHNLRLIVYIWQRNYSMRIPSGHPGLADALQCAAAGLMRAAEKFNPLTGRTFGTYAYAWIRKGFGDYFERDNRMVRIPAAQLQAVRSARKIRDRIKAEAGRTASWDELAALLQDVRTKPPSAALLEVLDRAEGQTLPRSLDVPVDSSDSEGASLGDLIPAPSDTAEREDLELLDRVEDYMLALSPEERRALQMTYRARPFTKVQIAKAIGCRKEEVDAVRDRALTNLRSLVPTG